MIFKADWEKTDTVHKLPTGMVEKMLQLACPDKELEFFELIKGGNY